MLLIVANKKLKKILMKLSTLQKYLRPNDPLNLYDAELKTLAKGVPIDSGLCTGKVYGGLSSKGGGSRIETHHIYPQTIFPVPANIGRTTSRIRVSQEVHVRLHRLLAEGLWTGDLHLYELALKSECNDITELVADIFKRRVMQISPTLWQRLWLKIFTTKHY